MRKTAIILLSVLFVILMSSCDTSGTVLVRYMDGKELLNIERLHVGETITKTELSHVFFPPKTSGCFWTLTEGSDEIFDFDQPVREDITLYPVWIPYIYTVAEKEGTGGTLMQFYPDRLEAANDEATVTLPDYIHEIDDRAFNDYENKYSKYRIDLYIPSTVTNFSGRDEITDSDYLRSIVFMDRTESFQDANSIQISRCENLERVVLPKGMTTLDSRTFDNCPAIAYLEIPESVTNISNLIWDKLTNLQEVRIGNSDLYAKLMKNIEEGKINIPAGCKLLQE